MCQLKSLSFCLIFLFSTLGLKAQTVFEKSLGFNGVITSMINTSDGGVAYCGQSLSDSGNVIIARYSSAGTRMWQKEFGTIAVETANDITQTTDGGFVVVGKHWDSEYGMLVLKVDSLGTIVWTTKLSRSFHDKANGVCAAKDGGVVISGESVDAQNNSMTIAVKLSAAGSLMWCRTFSGFIDGGYSIASLYNGHYAMTGRTNAGAADNIGVFSFDSVNVYWSWSIGSSASELTSFNHELLQTADSGLVFTGTTNSITPNGSDIFIAKLTAAGSPHWLRTIGTSMEEYGTSLAVTSNGILIGGYQQNPVTGVKDPMIVKMQLNGLLSWSYLYAGTSDHPVQTVSALSGGEIVVGSQWVNGAASSEPTLWKLSATGNACKVKTGVGTLSFLSAWNTLNVFGNTASIFVIPLSLNSFSSGTENGVCSCSGSVPVTASLPVQSICQGNSATLNISWNSGYNYSVYRNNVFWSAVSSPVFTLTQGGHYKVIQQSGCATDTSNNVYLNVNPSPTVSVSASGRTKICSGKAVTLQANSQLGVNYQWMANGANIPGATLPSYTATQTGDYTVMVYYPLTGCLKNSTPTQVTVLPLPPASAAALGATTFCTGDSVVLQANNGSGYTYQWRLNGNPMAGATSISYTAKSAGTYKVRVRDTNGCTQISSGVVVTVPCRISELSENDVQVFPNPAASEINFSSDISAPVIYRLSDESGRLLKDGVWVQGDAALYVGDIAPGVCFLEITVNNERSLRRIVIVR